MLGIDRRHDYSSSLVSLLCSLFLGIFYNQTYWRKIFEAYPFKIENIGWYFSLLVLLSGIIYLFFELCSFKSLFKKMLVFIFFISSFSANMVDSYGYIFSANTFINMLETHMQETLELVTISLILYVLFLFIVPSYIILKIPIKYSNKPNHLKRIFLSIIVIIFNVVLFGKSYASFFRNRKEIRYYSVPVTPVYAFSKFIRVSLKGRSEKIKKLGHNIRKKKTGTKKKLIIYVVGETARAFNFSLNNYQRDTNPKLSKVENLYSFKNFYSCGTETSISLPCMFSHFEQSNFSLEKAKSHENLLDVLKKADVDILWRDNDNGCKGVCDRVLTHNINEWKDPNHYDEILLRNIDDYIKNIKKDSMIVLHQLGNHGPAYYKRYPEEFKKFLPQCESNQLSDCTNEQIVNSYDNAILYTDHILFSVIQILKKYSKDFDTAMIYVSDHGESLGELGIYLHGLPFWVAPDYQKHVPAIFWFSPEFPLSMKKQQIFSTLEKKYSHDNLFHTILNLLGVECDEYKKALDLFTY